MKRLIKQILAVSALAVASTSAFADVTQTQVNTAQSGATLTNATQNNGSPGTASGLSTVFSSLLFVAYNTDGSFSQVQSLGMPSGTPTAAANFTVSNTDEAGLALTFDVGTSLLASNAGSLVWGVYAYDLSGTPSTQNDAWRLASTVTSGSSVSSVTPTTATFAGANNGIQNFLTTNPSGSAVLTSTTVGASDNWTTSTNLTNLTSSIATTIGATGSLLMYLFDSNIGANTATPGSYTAYAGLWTLNAASGDLVYAVDGGTTVVPLPAAVWLLMSGLAGLGVVSRRKSGMPVAA